MGNSMQMRQTRLFPPKSLLTMDVEAMHSDAAMKGWWDKANQQYEKLTKLQKEYVDQRWKDHKGPAHPVYFTYYCTTAANSVPKY